LKRLEWLGRGRAKEREKSDPSAIKGMQSLLGNVTDYDGKKTKRCRAGKKKKSGGGDWAPEARPSCRSRNSLEKEE